MAGRSRTCDDPLWRASILQQGRSPNAASRRPTCGALTAAAALVISSVARGDSIPFYCGSRIIDVGMTEDFVGAHCGLPDSQTTELREVRSSNNLVLGTTTVDRWTWRRGYNGTRVLVFIDGKLQSIQQF